MKAGIRNRRGHGARLLIASQAPGMKVHKANTPFWDASGVRLRSWLGLDEGAFFDRSRVAIIPMAFCFPGYDAKGSDLLPPPICASASSGCPSKVSPPPPPKGLEAAACASSVGKQ